MPPLPPRLSAPPASSRAGSVLIANHQRKTQVDKRLLRRLVRLLLIDLLERDSFDLTVNLVGVDEITLLNQTFLRHRGSTDVITFDYREANSPVQVHGELFVCLPVAHEQARRFGTTWQRELARYVVHGILHLCGYDDAEPRARARMKRAEDRALKRLGTAVFLDKLGRPAAFR